MISATSVSGVSQVLELLQILACKDRVKERALFFIYMRAGGPKSNLNETMGAGCKLRFHNIQNEKRKKAPILEWKFGPHYLVKRVIAMKISRN